MTTSSPRSGLVARLDRQLHELVVSLDDLEAELAAGDLEPDDFEVLSDSYKVRIADTMRRLEAANGGEPDPSLAANSSGPRSRRGRLLAVAGGLTLFATGVGFLLAQTAGERGVNDQLTGSVDLTTQERTVRCQQLGSEGGELLEALQCFDEVLEEDPANIEALTYRAWYLVLAGSSSPDASATQQAELFASAQVYLDRAVDIDPTYPDARAFRAAVYDRQADVEAACSEVEALVALDPPPFFVQQTQAIVDRNNCQ